VPLRGSGMVRAEVPHRLRDPSQRLARHRPCRSIRDRVRQHWERLCRHGLRPVQIWLPDVRAPEFIRPIVTVQDDRVDATASVTVCPFTTNPVDARCSGFQSSRPTTTGLIGRAASWLTRSPQWRDPAWGRDLAVCGRKAAPPAAVLPHCEDPAVRAGAAPRRLSVCVASAGTTPCSHEAAPARVAC
jgi:hypothetical protein